MENVWLQSSRWFGTSADDVLTWLGGVDAGGADNLWGGANRDLDGALLCGGVLLCGGLLELLWHWLVVLQRRGLWSLVHGGRLTVLAGRGWKRLEAACRYSDKA